MKRILVTGGAGFLGSHLVDRLLERNDDEVIVLDNFFTGPRRNVVGDLPGVQHPRLDVVRGDVVEPFHFEVDEIYHLACPASPVHYQRNPARTIETAVLGTSNALKLARDTGARILIASTSEIYGDPLVHPQTEDYWGNVSTLGPRACYDEGKRCGESLAAAWAQQYDVEVRMVRIFNTYGPRMAVGDGRVVSNFVVQALRGESITIYGDGMQTRSFCYVDDTVRGLIAAMRWHGMPNGVTGQVHPINLGNPEETTMRQLAEAVLAETGSRSTVRYMPLPKDDPTRRRPDITRAQSWLGWRPEVQLGDGIKRTVAYFYDLLK